MRPAVPPETWGSGEAGRVVLVHGSLATGPLEWESQRPLVDEGYQLLVPTRRAYASRFCENNGASTSSASGGSSAGQRASACEGSFASEGEDFLVDGQDIAELLGDGAHLVGHSYGALVALVAARERPDAVRSLVLAEPPLFEVSDHPAAARLQRDLVHLFERDVDDREFLTAFLDLVGTDVTDLPPSLVDELTTMAPALRRARQPWQTPLPVGELADAPFPTVLVSGAHHPAFTAVCVAMADELGAQHHVVAGAGHEVQQVADRFNAILLQLWRAADSR